MPAHRLATARPRTVALLVTVLAVGGMMLKNPLTPALLLSYGLTPLAILLSGGLLGIAILNLFRLGPLPLRWTLIGGAAIGIGVLALLVLFLGVVGLLDRTVWMAILLAIAVAGVLGLTRSYRKRPVAEHQPGAGALHWLWLLVLPHLVIALLSACVPPGYLWAEEGNGYDVLEYHLEMPKEYQADGRIGYAPHNVYANFPANVEMLYLLSMVLVGDPIDAAIPCKILNAALGLLFVGAAWLIGRERSAVCGVLTAVIATSAGWLPYLCGVAYVENGLLFFGMAAFAAAMRGMAATGRNRRWMLLAGMLAGLACGCKYPAVPMIAGALAIGTAAAVSGGMRRRLAAAIFFGLGAVLTFSPWAIKNQVMTGNPVFPLAGGWTNSYPPGWAAEESSHFEESHRPPPRERALSARLAGFLKHVPLDHYQRFGPLILLAAVWQMRRLRSDGAVRLAAVMLGVQVLAWLFATHLYARFAVPMLIPLAVAAGRVEWRTVRSGRIWIGAIVMGSLVTAGFSVQHYRMHMYPGGEAIPLEGATNVFTSGQWPMYEHLAVINSDLPADARILMVGDARAFYLRRTVDYCVVFNRSPFVELVESGAPAAEIIEWLRQEGYTHVLVNWAEIRRLSNSRYSFSPMIQRELFTRLTQAGLFPIASFPAAPHAGSSQSMLYQVR
jgi:4-amino-4-deoxy-L-arabinose transferase-like glycosyltransferase